MKQRFFYCPVCGHKLIQKFLHEKERLVCSVCNRIHYENPIVGVAAILLNEQRQVLLVKRARNVSYPGLWCIPCGYLEYDEEIRDGMVREVYEETGLVVEASEVFAVHSNFHDENQHTVGIWFLTKNIKGNIQAGDDAAEVAWFNPLEVPPLAFPTDQIVLADLAKKLRIN